MYHLKFNFQEKQRNCREKRWNTSVAAELVQSIEKSHNFKEKTQYLMYPASKHMKTFMTCFETVIKF